LSHRPRPMRSGLLPSEYHHTAQVSGRACVGCHMPQVTVATNLEFTNHWIGIYDGANANLMPPARGEDIATEFGAVSPIGPFSWLRRVLQPCGRSTKKHLRSAEELGVQDPKVARSASDLGLFLAQTGDAAGRKRRYARRWRLTRRIEHLNWRQTRKPCRNPGKVGQRCRGIQLYQQAAAGSDAKVAARSYASLRGWIRRSRRALTQRHRRDDSRLWKRRPARRVLLHQLALVLREHGDDGAAEPLLRRALTIQETAASPDQHLTVEILIRSQSDRGSAPVRSGRSSDEKSLLLAEKAFGPESVELSATCTNLADVLWNKHDLAGRGTALWFARSQRIARCMARTVQRQPQTWRILECC